LTDDDRYGLAARAEAGARANRPTHLVALAVIVLLVTLAVTLFAWRSDAGAARRLRNESVGLASVRVASDRLAELRAQLETAPGEDRNRPIPDMLSRLSNLAREAGLETAPPIPKQSFDAATNARRVNYVYEGVRTESLEAMVRFADLAVERIPGMHIRRFSVSPQPNAWLVHLTFSRYERTE
jgi:hypothetical protein